MNVAVLGAGGWGTALAVLLARSGHRVALWSRRCELAEALLATRENAAYLPGVRLPEGVRPVCTAERAVEGAAFVLVAVPTKGVRTVLAGMPPVEAYVSAVKGVRFAEGRLLRISQIMRRAAPAARVAVLSGPNLALEVARGLPAAAVVASEDAELAARVQRALGGPTFRVYTSPDVAGVELGGALKNVMALAAGMADGLELGDNAKAALLTRGLREMVRFGTAHGGAVETFYGLSGLGDLMATAMSPLSRNRSAGERIARGATLADLETGRQVVEGVHTTAALHEWAARSGEELPITEAVWRVVYRGDDPRRVLEELMRREPKPE
ncbi:NAD(P)H-dependent glycerol-3-phosphate dehydrogenase [Oceanithermus desulfurans]|uniref:Glycerol-3-phosphate dehydrogenase [NAD(P)+] n=2 Tax=Oceanithermus desulfurans TaxID=227924 RepID=A0A511RIX2_9DEIN|nr:NAD(P)H-dependent glycerol-3-phosphate dehydrogenase [Oceanithermus desulfurans]MBB6028853.1 glycerol-3-phosphate dehydrogenase (NAD(P)+) [Oceanithermus desulfurans]GEM88912.1 glycerol-3-phosphate dehydrogenase [NAD(P)+] [Oceanithermus desulfurans NBRC 100063]